MEGKPAKDKTGTERPDLLNWLGFRRFRDWDFSRARPLGGLFGCLGAATALALIVIFFATLASFILAVTGLHKPPESFDMRSAGVLLAFLLGAPFVIWRTMVAAKQAEIAAETLFNEKINAASTGLSARRQVTRVVKVNSEEKVLTEWQDDLVARSAAIDRLEGLVHERPAAANRVASLLSVYVVELSEEPGNRPKTPPENATPEDLREWARGLRRKRSDMERAAQVLGRLQQIEGVKLEDGRIDLRRANLQGFDLHGLDFSKARFSRARLEGAWLGGALLMGANFRMAHIKGANFNGAHLEGVSFREAHLEGVLLKEAVLEEADLRSANLNGAYLRGAHLEGADLSEAYLGGTQLIGAWLDRADLWNVPLEGADIRDAHLEEASLWYTILDAHTLLKGAKLHGATVRHVDLSSVEISEDQVNSIFGDASVNLPPDLERPTHWPDTKLDWDEFYDERILWLSNPASYTPPQDRA